MEVVKSEGGTLLAVLSGAGCFGRGGAEGDSVREEWAECEVSNARRQEISACTCMDRDSEYATVAVWKLPGLS